jgi:hypothetical protein
MSFALYSFLHVHSFVGHVCSESCRVHGGEIAGLQWFIIAVS